MRELCRVGLLCSTLAGLAACGRVGFESERVVGGFEQAVAIAELNTDGEETDPSGTGDGLELYFVRRADGAIYRTERTRVGERWRAPEIVAELDSSGWETDPDVSRDGLEMWLGSTRDGSAGGTDIYYASRARRDQPWGRPQRVAQFASPEDDCCVTVTDDGRTLFLTSNADGGLGGYDIYVSTRYSRDDPWGAPVLVEELSSSSDDANPHVSADGLSLYFDSDRRGRQGRDLYVATRPSTGQPFGPPALMIGVSTDDADERDAFITNDGRYLYFTSDRAGDPDLYIAER